MIGAGEDKCVDNVRAMMCRESGDWILFEQTVALSGRAGSGTGNGKPILR